MLNRTPSLQRTDLVVAAMPWNAVPPTGLNDRLVWVVDPETSHRESIAWATRLCLNGIAFESIGSQVEALARLPHTAQWPAIVITDFRGDLKINGAEFIARARRLGRPETRFVMFSGIVEDAAQFRRVAGKGYDLPDAIVPKPDVVRLGKVLAGLLPPMPLGMGWGG